MLGSRRIVLRGVVFACLAGISLSASAASSVTVADAGYELRVLAGQLSGESGEYVYDADGSASGTPGYKISELNWELNSVPMLGLDLRIPVYEQIGVNLEFWKNATEGDGTMDDYDWMYIGADWSHWSHHDDTTVRDVTRLDLNADYRFHQFDWGKLELLGILGYRRDHFDCRPAAAMASTRSTAIATPMSPSPTYPGSPTSRPSPPPIWASASPRPAEPAAWISS